MIDLIATMAWAMLAALATVACARIWGPFATHEVKLKLTAQAVPDGAPLRQAFSGPPASRAVGSASGAEKQADRGPVPAWPRFVAEAPPEDRPDNPTAAIAYAGTIQTIVIPGYPTAEEFGRLKAMVEEGAGVKVDVRVRVGKRRRRVRAVAE